MLIRNALNVLLFLMLTLMSQKKVSYSRNVTGHNLWKGNWELLKLLHVLLRRWSYRDEPIKKNGHKPYEFFFEEFRFFL